MKLSASTQPLMARWPFRMDRANWSQSNLHSSLCWSRKAAMSTALPISRSAVWAAHGVHRVCTQKGAPIHEAATLREKSTREDGDVMMAAAAFPAAIMEDEDENFQPDESTRGTRVEPSTGSEPCLLE